jgi:uncharacterized protein
VAVSNLDAVVAAALPRLKIFPLPSAVLLPGTVLPLHIFEPRYREMVNDALATDRVLALAMLEPGHEAEYAGRPPIRSVCGAGVIIQEEKLSGGRLNILLRGVARASILEEHPPERRYREAKAQLLEEIPSQRPASLDLLRRFLFALAPRMSKDESTALLTAAARAESASDLADTAAAILLGDVQARQAMLETRETDRRIDALMAAASATLLQSTAPDGGLKH